MLVVVLCFWRVAFGRRRARGDAGAGLLVLHRRPGRDLDGNSAPLGIEALEVDARHAERTLCAADAGLVFLGEVEERRILVLVRVRVRMRAEVLVVVVVVVSRRHLSTPRRSGHRSHRNERAMGADTGVGQQKFESLQTRHDGGEGRRLAFVLD